MSDSKLYSVELGGDLGDVAIMHRLVRCKECAHMSKYQLVGGGCYCMHFGFPLPDPDGFCAWGKTEEEAQHGKR